jgi:hypothetical protein
VDSRLIFRLDRLTIVYNTAVVRALNDFVDVGGRGEAPERGGRGVVSMKLCGGEGGGREEVLCLPRR